jgi:hypothetical protein
MNISSPGFYFVQQMLWRSPLVLAYVVGIVVCAARARRAPGAATLAIIGLGMMLLSTVAVTGVQAMVVAGGGGTVASRGQALAVVSLVGMLVTTAGVALLIAAVFVGRPRDVRGGFEVPMATVAPGR